MSSVRHKRDGDVERHGREAAHDADEDGEQEEALRLGGREADLGSEQVEAAKSNRLAQTVPRSLPPVARELE